MVQLLRFYTQTTGQSEIKTLRHPPKVWQGLTGWLA